MSLYRIRNVVVAAVLIIIGYLIQYGIISRIPILSCGPNIILIITFAYGYCRGKIAGMWTGFFGGLLIDVFYCQVLGYNALVLLIIGFISGIWNSYFYSDDLYIPLLLILGSDLVYSLIYYFFWFVLRARFEFSFYLIKVILPEFLLTLIAALIIYKPLSLLIERLSIIPEE